MNLRSYLDGLPRGGISELAGRLGVSTVYLMQLAARQGGRQPAPDLCIRIEKETGGSVSRMELRDDAEKIWPEEADRLAGREVQHLTKPAPEIDDSGIDLEPSGK